MNRSSDEPKLTEYVVFLDRRKTWRYEVEAASEAEAERLARADWEAAYDCEGEWGELVAEVQEA